MGGRRSSVGRASLVVASVLLLVLSSLPLLVPSCLHLLRLHPRNVNVRRPGNLSLSGLPPRAPRLLAKALCSTTGSTVNPIAGTVARLATQPQVRIIRSRIGRNCWPWQPGCERWRTSKQRCDSRKLLLRRSSRSRMRQAPQSLECRKKYGCAEDESACGDGGQGGSLDGGA